MDLLFPCTLGNILRAGLYRAGLYNRDVVRYFYEPGFQYHTLFKDKHLVWC